MSPELEHFIRILPEPSFLVQRTGRILLANTAAATTLGLDVDDLPGREVASLVHDSAASVESLLRLCARSRQLIPGSLTWRGRENALEMRCDGAVLVPRTDDRPAVLFLRCRPKAEATDRFQLLNRKIEELSREIIQRRKAEQQRDELLQAERAARIEAERISRMKDEFLATVSHELRTPLTAILGWAQILDRNDGFPPEVTRAAAIIGRNARAQKQLIEDLLDMSRIISGKIRLDVQRVELQEVIEAAVEAIRPAAEAKNIRLQVTLDPIAGPVKGDATRLQQIVWNLVSNAVKFTPKGGRVQVFLERVNSHVEITVADTGEGIRPEFLPHLFERFQQADASSTRRHGGLGLGLSIVKQLAELHGGTVRAKSPGEGKGSIFQIMLPLMILHPPPGSDAPAPAPGSAPGSDGESRVHPAAGGSGGAACPGGSPSKGGMLAGVCVLVVDDEPDARELITHLLEAAGARVAPAASADEALEALTHERPHLILSDIGMPGRDGYEFMRTVRERPAEAGGRTPAIALTAFARSEDRTRAMRAGYNVHLSKPVEPAELIATAASLASLRTQNAAE